MAFSQDGDSSCCSFFSNLAKTFTWSRFLGNEKNTENAHDTRLSYDQGNGRLFPWYDLCRASARPPNARRLPKKRRTRIFCGGVKQMSRVNASRLEKGKGGEGHWGRACIRHGHQKRAGDSEVKGPKRRRAARSTVSTIAAPHIATHRVGP